jgi:hypothetical protein
MKVRRIAGLLSVVVAASMSFAQDAPSPEIKTGSKALLFTFNGLANLSAGSYIGGIGGKYYLMDQIALRGSLQFGVASQSIPNAVDSVGEDGSRSAMLFGITGGGEYHLSFARVSPFGGAELAFSMVSTQNKSPINTNANKDRTITTNSAAGELGYVAATNLGINGFGGVEFFITKEISLSGEYKLGYQMAIRPDQKVKTSVGSTTSETTTKVPDASFFGISNTGAITLAVYF